MIKLKPLTTKIPSYRNQDLQKPMPSKSVDWFLYEGSIDVFLYSPFKVNLPPILSVGHL